MPAGVLTAGEVLPVGEVPLVKVPLVPDVPSAKVPVQHVRLVHLLAVVPVFFLWPSSKLRSQIVRLSSPLRHLEHGSRLARMLHRAPAVVYAPLQPWVSVISYFANTSQTLVVCGLFSNCR